MKLDAIVFMVQYIADHLTCLSVVQIDAYFEEDLMRSLDIYRQSSSENNTDIKKDFDAVQHLVNDTPVSLIQ